MKLISAFFFLLFTVNTHAQELEAKSFQGLLDVIQESEFKYKETGKLAGYFSTHSCMYVAEKVVIFKNYCWPVRDYPAKGFTILSEEFGIIKLYQEQVPGILKRDLDITQFPAIANQHLPENWQTADLKTIDASMEEMYHQFFPACWSTNFSLYHETHEANCTLPVDNVKGFSDWSAETQTIVNDEAAWKALMISIQNKLPAL